MSDIFNIPREQVLAVRKREAYHMVIDLVNELIYGPLIEWRVDGDDITERIMAVVNEILEEYIK